MVKHNTAQQLRRREFLRMLAGGAGALLVGDVLSGCGSGGGASSSSSSRTVTGSINLSQIGGSNLTVVSAFQQGSTVSAQGQFTTPASALGSQLLGVTDGAGNLRSLTITVPNLQSTTTFDANSTALVLVLLNSWHSDYRPCNHISTDATDHGDRFVRSLVVLSRPKPPL